MKEIISKNFRLLESVLRLHFNSARSCFYPKNWVWYFYIQFSDTQRQIFWKSFKAANLIYLQCYCAGGSLKGWLKPKICIKYRRHNSSTIEL